MRKPNGHFFEHEDMLEAGLTVENLKNAIEYTHQILDEIDHKMVEVGSDRLSQMVELANLSSMIGNLLGAGIARFSNGRFVRNGPHKYPDLLSKEQHSKDIEIKISLERNKPKGHLAKEGYYLTSRYVLIGENLELDPNERGEIAQIWEVRFGYLKEEHFNLSNTPGDSGKTAVINKEGMDNLHIVYVNIDYCPYSSKSRTYKEYENLINNN